MPNQEVQRSLQSFSQRSPGYRTKSISLAHSSHIARFRAIRVLPVKLSNSQASRACSARPRCGKPARAQFVFCWSLPGGSGLFVLPKEGAERRMAQRVRALARSTGPILPDRSRLTALHCGVFNPWGPASLLTPMPVVCHRRGKGQGTSPGRHNAPGGRSKDSRDRGVRKPRAQAPLPIHAQFALQSAPLWMGMVDTYSNNEIQSRTKNEPPCAGVF